MFPCKGVNSTFRSSDDQRHIFLKLSNQSSQGSQAAFEIMTGRMRVGKMDEHFTIEMATLLHAPQKFNMEPENDGFQKGISFSGG